VKKFSEFEIANHGNIPIQSHEMLYVFQTLMQNQNEIIDWIEKQDKDIYAQNTTESIKEENRKIERGKQK
jgi:uncharacterized protein YpmB